jgi:hypothetical protein
MRLYVSVALAAWVAGPALGLAEEATGERQPATERLETQYDLLAEVEAEPRQPAPVAPARAAAGPGVPGGDQPVLGEARGGELNGRQALGGVKLRLGRDAGTLGRLPSDPRAAYGEVGLAIDLGGSLSLTPSYRVDWNHDQDELRDGDADHALKLGANFKF